MRDAIALRRLTLDELDAVSGGKRKLIRVEHCTTTLGKDGQETQKCKVVKEIHF
jgi:hypothetical protein